MARIRSIPPDLATDPKLIACSIPARFLAVMAWPWHDDHGCIGYDPRRIRLNAFPNDVTLDAAPLIDELLASGWFALYEEPSGRRFLWCTEFGTYQKVPHAGAPKFAAFKDCQRLTSPQEVSRTLTNSHEDSGGFTNPHLGWRDGSERSRMSEGVGGKGAEGAEGAERMERKEPTAPLADAAARNNPLPPSAIAIIQRLPSAKRADGRRQLLASLSPAGAPLPNGDPARASGDEHLEWCCAEKLRQFEQKPPKQIGLDVLFVLYLVRDTYLEWRSNAEKRDAPDSAAKNGTDAPPALTFGQELEFAREWSFEQPGSVVAEIDRLATERFTKAPSRERDRWCDEQLIARWRDAGSPTAAYSVVHGGPEGSERSMTRERSPPDPSRT